MAQAEAQRLAEVKAKAAAEREAVEKAKAMVADSSKAGEKSMKVSGIARSSPPMAEPMLAEKASECVPESLSEAFSDFQSP